MARQEANLKILERIHGMVKSCPNWRFHQILQNIGVEKPGQDQWYEESEETLKNTKVLETNDALSCY